MGQPGTGGTLNLEELGLESFGIGQAPASGAVTDTNSVIVAADPDMAYCIVTLLTVSGGSIFMAQNAPAVADKGQLMILGVGGNSGALKLFGGQSVEMIADTAAQTATVAFQVFLRGLPRQGKAV